MASVMLTVFFTFLAIPSFVVVQSDQIRGEIIEPGSDTGGQTGPEPVTRETIYFLTTPDDDTNENFEVTGPHKPFQRRTTEPGFRPTEEPAFGGRGRETTEGPDTDRFRPGSRTTPDSLRPGRYTTERRPFGGVTDDPYERYTTDRSSGGRYTTERRRPFGGFTEAPSGRYTTERYPFGRYTTEKRRPFGEVTEDPYDRYTTERYPFGRPGSRTTPDTSRPGRYTTERRRPFGGVTEDPFDRYTTERYPFGRYTTERRRPFGGFTEDPYDRYTTERTPFGRYTTERRRPFGGFTEDPFGRYTTERYPFGRYTTERRRGGVTDDPFDRYTTERYRPGSGLGGDRDRGTGTDGVNAKCQSSTAVRNAARDRLNVCEQFIRCCSEECRAKGMEPKGNCKHDTIDGFDRSTSCPCKPPRTN